MRPPVGPSPMPDPAGPPAGDELEAGSAAAHACPAVPRIGPAATIAELRARLVGHRYESVADMAVCDDDRLVGLLSIETALAAPGHERVGDLMDPDPPVVGPDTDQEKAAWKAVHHGETSLGVVDDAGRFAGLVPPRRLLTVLLAEHDEDLARVGGFLADTRSARRASEEPVSRRLAHRLPWLLLGLVGSLAAAGVVNAFESQLEATVTLAFFVPGVVYMADAVGTQTEALIIRGLSVGVPIRRVVRNEILTGLAVGLVLAVAFLPLGVLFWGDLDVALAVAVALLAASSVATAVAMALPWRLHRLGTDPAFGSGPLATVIQDLVSLLIYFTVATVLVA